MDILSNSDSAGRGGTAAPALVIGYLTLPAQSAQAGEPEVRSSRSVRDRVRGSCWGKGSGSRLPSTTSTLAESIRLQQRRQAIPMQRG
jgi:hypothetical protein